MRRIVRPARSVSIQFKHRSSDILIEADFGGLISIRGRHMTWYGHVPERTCKFMLWGSRLDKENCVELFLDFKLHNYDKLELAPGKFNMFMVDGPGPDVFNSDGGW